MTDEPPKPFGGGKLILDPDEAKDYWLSAQPVNTLSIYDHHNKLRFRMTGPKDTLATDSLISMLHALTEIPEAKKIMDHFGLEEVTDDGTKK